MPPASGASFAQFFPAAPRAARDKAKEREQRARVKAVEPPSSTASPNGVNGRHTPTISDKAEESAHTSRPLYGSDTVVSQATDDGDALMSGDTTVTVGSASSHASTASSVFSTTKHNGHVPSQSHNAYLTPLTTTDSPAHVVSVTHHAESHASSILHTQAGARVTTTHDSFAPTVVMANKSAQLVERPSAIDSTRATTAMACTYNPWLDEHLSISEKQRAKPKFKNYGPISDDAPTFDPRLATAGRLNYINVDYHLPRSRLRQAPYNLKPYRYDAKTSVGPGPPTQIVVTGFSPLITFSKVVNIFSTFGDIAESSNKMHPEIGNFLGFATFRFRDSKPNRARPRPVSAVDAARRAVKQMNGKRIEENQVKVEFDPEGRKSGRMLEEVVKADREKTRSTAKPPRIPTAPRAASGPVGMAPGPPPTAPKAPAALRQVDPSRQTGPGPSPALEIIEREDIASKLTTQPVIFVTGEKVPVKHQTISHLKKRLKAFQWDSLRADMTGYFVIFEDSHNGRAEALRCYRTAKGTLFFNYELGMVLYQSGMHPREHKTVAPTKPAEQRRRAFSPERRPGIDLRQQSREEEMDLENEKRQRATDFDPVREAEAVIRKEMTEHLIKHIRTKISVPTLFEFLDPAQHQTKLQQLNLATFSGSTLPSLGVVNKQPTVGTPNSRADPIERRTNRVDVGALPRIRKAKHANLMARRGGFVDPFARQRPAAKARAVRSLHHRLKVIDSDDESEDAVENRSSLPRDTEEPESRPRSRMSTDDDEPDRDDVASSWGPAEEDSMTEASFSVADGGSLPTKKRKLELPIELALKRQRKSDEELFGITIDKIETEYALHDEEDVAMPDVEVKDETDSSRATPALLEVEPIATKKAAVKRPKKTKKQVLEEREALKKQQQEVYEQEALRQAQEAEQTLEPPKTLPKAPVEKVNADPTMYPTEPDQRAFTLPKKFALDLASYRSLEILAKDRPDLNKFKKKFRASDVVFPEGWLWQRSRMLSLNAAELPTSKLPCIDGYYVPNSTGCARTEGIKKIFNSEKAKYLPHVIKVKKAREERVAQAGKASKATAPMAAKVANESAVSKGSSRAHRATQRRIANDLTEQQKAYGQDSDLLRFNQLQKRKKPVKFARSAIHNWGLFAMVDIAKDEMIIEYVGEEVRQSVSKVRERKYDQAGVGSSYLFSLSEGKSKNLGDENVIDATKKGGIARFINHSCMPNCMAKIIQVNGGPRIVLYALRDIAQNEELTYDYKFEFEVDADDRVPCLCGTIACKGYLN